MKKNNISEIFNRFIRSVNELSVIDNTFFSLDEFKKNISLVAKDIMQSDDDFEKKLIHNTYENNEAHDFFRAKITENEQQKVKELVVLTKHLDSDLKKITDELDSIKKINIQSFKDYEQEFINKQKFLNENKKSNKDEYMNRAIKINQERILANHTYHETANDLDNRNEQTNYEYNHTAERYTQNYHENVDIVTENYNEKLKEIENQAKNEIDKIGLKIAALKRLNVDNTIEFNESITNLDKESKRRQRYGFVPFDLETAQLNDEHDEKTHSYAEIEENILNEFKSQLQEIDNDIQQLRKEQREFQYNTKITIDKNKIEINLETSKHLGQTDYKINQLKNQYRKNKDLEIKKEINRLRKERQEFEKNQNKKLLRIEKEAKEYQLVKELEYIEKFELLRVQKNKFEAIKSNAMKNLNAEKDHYNTNLNAKLNNIISSKETFVDIEQCEENKQVLDLRLNRDLENTNTDFEINEYDRNIKRLEFERKANKLKAKYQKNSQINLLDINLDYQNMVLENRRNFANISTMLEIQKNGLIRDFVGQLSRKKMDNELVKYNFYNECDNIQYKIYKLEHDYSSKILDAEMDHATKIAEVKRLAIKANNVHDEKSIANYSLYRECMERINFYKERFEIEKRMFDASYQLFDETFKSIVQLESYYIKLLATAPITYFEENKKTFSYLLELLRDMKTNIITKLFSNETTVINSRIDFDKGLKYSRIINALQEERDSFLQQLELRSAKIQETLSGYNSTIERFRQNIEALKKDNHEKYDLIVKHYFHHDKNDGFDLSETRKTINSNKEIILNQTNQISAIRLNISELEQTEKNNHKEINKTQKKYAKRFKAITDAQISDTRIYNKTLNAIKNHYNNIKNLSNCYTKYLSDASFTYNNIPFLINKIINVNNKLYATAKEKIIDSNAAFSNAVNKELRLLSENYIKSYERNDNQIYTAKQNDENNYKNRINVLNHMHDAVLNNLKEHYDKELKVIYTELEKTNNIQLKVQKDFDNYVNNLTVKHENDLLCHKENFAMYEKNYTENNNHFQVIYKKKVKETNLRLAKQLKEIAQSIDNYHKNDISRHTSNINLRKNTISEFKNDYNINKEKYNSRIKEINKRSHKTQTDFETLMKKNQEEYNSIQKNSRQEFKSQLSKIERKVRKRIRENQNKYKKSFWK